MKAKLYKTLSMLCFCVLILQGNAVAQGDQKPLVPLPSVPDFTRGAGWGGALALVAEYETAYDGSDERELEIEPGALLQFRRANHVLFWEGNELGWRGLASDQWLFQAGARYEGGLEPNDSKKGALNGLQKRDSHWVGFFEVRRAIGRNWRNWMGGRLMGGPNEFGWLGVVAAGHRFGARDDGTGTEVYAFSTFGSAKFVNKDFGVSAQDYASSGMAETSLKGGYRSTGLNVVDRRNLSGGLQLVSNAGLEFYSNAIQKSPIARKDKEFEMGLSLLWRF